MVSLAKQRRKLLRAQKGKQASKEYTIESKLNFDLKEIIPLTKNQERAFFAFPRKHLFLHGLAGTGKSFMACYLGLKEIFSNTSPHKKIVIVRSLVQTREMGHLPGNDKEKMKVYEAPYFPIFAELFGRGDAYQLAKQKGLVDFISTSFIRGITLNDAIVIVDECQNMTAHELHSIITRLGHNCKIIFCGDIKQTDLNKRKEVCGLKDFMKIIRAMNCFEFIEYHEEDIVRSAFVKNYIITKNKLEDADEIEVIV